MYFLEPEVVARGVKPRFVNFSVYAKFRVVNADIALSLLRVCLMCVSSCRVDMGVDRTKAVTGGLGGSAYASVRLTLQLDC